MFPIILDITKLNILLIGDGPATRRRLALLQEAGCEPVEVKGAEEAMRLLQRGVGSRESGVGSENRPPTTDYRLQTSIVFIADFDRETTARIYAEAKEAGALVNAEDIKEYCDFHVPAIVRRGDLLMTVSTNAKSPRLARRLRQWLESRFGQEWTERLDKISIAREQWKKDGAGFKQLADNTDAIIDGEGWLEVQQR